MTICNPSPILVGKINLPSSKSLSNRALIIQYLSSNPSPIFNLSEANDTQLMQKLIDEIKKNQVETFLDCEDAGTVMRFLTAVCATLPNRIFTLSGTPRMQDRPMQELTNALTQMQVPVRFLQKDGFPPFVMEGCNIQQNEVRISGTISSQFISALCLISPCLPQGLRIHIEGNLVSKPYVEMTLGLMKLFGVECYLNSNRIVIPHSLYTYHPYTVENDWSSATFFYAMAILKPCRIELPHLMERSLQGDAWIATLAKNFGVQTVFEKENLWIESTTEDSYSGPLELNLVHHPDLAIPIIVCCALKFNQISIKGIAHLELKESKRLSALQTELCKIGVELIYTNDVLRFEKVLNFDVPTKVQFKTYGDHRIAMALSLVCLYDIEVELNDTDCVRKSFPNFWKEIKKLGFLHTKE